MDFESYARSKATDYAALAETVGAILRAALGNHPDLFRLQQLQHRAKEPNSLFKKLQARGADNTDTLENEIKDLAGCRLVFYSNSDVAGFLGSGIVQDNFDVDWDRTKIHHPVPGETAAENLFISNNYVVKFKEDRTALVEYSRFKGLYCEVQVQTILNHAWSEMTHDVIYKAPNLEGFGSKQLSAIQRRLQEIMKKHLLPAGYEFQKALTDYERLLNGKELFDRGALKAAIECADNNERLSVLERFRDYVLPYYDDIEGEYLEINDQLVAVVVAARATKPRAIETPLGNFDGISVDRIVGVVADVLAFVRYVDVAGTFDAVCELFPGALTDQERKHLLGVIKKLAQHDLEVWRQAGPLVQTILVQRIRNMSPSAREPVRPAVVTALGEALKSELRGSSSTYNAVTLEHASAVASDALMRMRSEAIKLLMELYDAARSEADKRKTKLAMFEATRFPSYGSATNDLLVCILQNSTVIVDFFASRAAAEVYEILQTLEDSFLLLYRWNGGLVGATPVDPTVDGSRADLIQRILKFRDAANANKGFVVYKILVGYESVFPPAWEDEDFDRKRKEEYRTQRIDEFVAEVNDSNADEWLAIIERCAETRSDDMATFPSFGLFLQKLGAAKPTVVFGYLDRMSERLTGFLGVMLSGLAESDRQDELAARISSWISEERHLAELAHYLQVAKRFDPSLLARLAKLGINRDNNVVVVNVMSTLGRRYADAPDGLIETVFLPAIEYFTGRRDARWLNLLWFLPDDRTPLLALTPKQIDVVLKNLVYLSEVESHGERVLSLLAKKRPQKVFDFFLDRLAYAEAKEDDERYNAVPYAFHGLQKRFVDVADQAVESVRRGFVTGNRMFQFGAGRLLASAYPDFSGRFRDKLLTYLRSGNRDDVEFVVRTLLAYQGQAFLNEACREAVRALTPDDDLLSIVQIVLESTGVLSGEFGHVQAYARKKQEMSGWLTDPDPQVRAFAEKRLLMINRQMAAEQRRSEEDLEMRKRMYDQPPDEEGDGEA